MDKYDYLAEFVYTTISKEDMRTLSRELESEGVVNDPKQIVTTLNDFFENKWDKIATQKPRTGNAKTQKENYLEFLKKDILSQKRLMIDNPYSKEKMDFEKFFVKYREATGQAFETSELPPRQEKLIRIALGKEKPQIGGDIKRPPPGQYFESYSTQIDNSVKAGHLSNVVKLRNAMRDMMISKNADKPINSFQAYELYNKADKALQPYYKNFPKSGEIRKPTKKFYVLSKDLPVYEKELSKLASEYKKDVPISEKQKIEQEVSGDFPYLSKNEIDKEVNKKLAEKIIDAPILDREIEKRYMQWKYNDANKKVQFEDLVGLSKVTNREFKFEIATKIDRIPDPGRPGKLKIVKDNIPYDGFYTYRSNLKERVSKAQQEIEAQIKETEKILEQTETSNSEQKDI